MLIHLLWKYYVKTLKPISEIVNDLNLNWYSYCNKASAISLSDAMMNSCCFLNDSEDQRSPTYKMFETIPVPVTYHCFPFQPWNELVIFLLQRACEDIFTWFNFHLLLCKSRHRKFGSILKMTTTDSSLIAIATLVLFIWLLWFKVWRFKAPFPALPALAKASTWLSEATLLDHFTG